MSVLSVPTFPHEILELFPPHVDRATLRAMRLVSKAMNDIAGPKLFSGLNIKFSPHAPPYIVEQLAMAASGQGPNVQWTKFLIIYELMDEDPWFNFDNLTPFEHREAFLHCQKTYLIPAILSLKNVHNARIDPKKDVDRYLDVLRAVKELPLLTELSMMCDPYLNVPLSVLSQFKSLHDFDISITRLSPPTVEAVRRLIERSAGLVRLSICQGSNMGYYADRESFDVNPIVDSDEILPFSSPPPSLKELTFSKDRVRFTDTSAPFFKSVTHLHIYEAGSNADPTFWSALIQTGVTLHTLSVYPVTPPLVNFLLSFTGMVEINIFCENHQRNYASDETRQYQEQFFHLVLPHHRLTLQSVCLGPPNHNAWSLTDAFLDQLLLCTSLRKLFMTSHIAPVIEFEGAASASDAQGASGNFISMDSLIRKLSKGLPLLEELYLRPSLAFLRNRGTNNWGDLEEAGLAEFLQLLEGVDLSEDAARCSFTIAAGRGRGSSSIDLHFNREIGRFVAPPIKKRTQQQTTMVHNGVVFTITYSPNP